MRSAPRYSQHFGDIFTDLIPALIKAAPGIIASTKQPKIVMTAAPSAPSAPSGSGGGAFGIPTPVLIGGAVLAFLLLSKKR